MESKTILQTFKVSLSVPTPSAPAHIQCVYNYSLNDTCLCHYTLLCAYAYSNIYYNHIYMCFYMSTSSPYPFKGISYLRRKLY